MTIFARLLAVAGMLALAGCATLNRPVGASGVSATTMALHQRLLALDTHLDTPALLERPRGFDITARHDVDQDGSQVDLPRMREGGLDGGFWAIFMGQGGLAPADYAKVRDRAISRAVAIHEMVAGHPDRLEIARTPADAVRINGQGKAIVFLSMENSWELGDDLTLMDTFYMLGVRLMGPVHNGNNQLADSASPGPKPPVSWGGLSPMGERYVQRANELGIVLDGSHASDAAIEQMIDLSAVPIILSHHGVRALNDSPRNLSDALLKKLAAKGGVAQMNTLFLKTLPPPGAERAAALKALAAKYPEGADALGGERYRAYLKDMGQLNRTFPMPRADIEDYMKQIVYAIRLIGVDHVGLGGADWDGGGCLTGYRDVTDMPRVTERLLKEGYTEADLAKLWGGNALRVMQQAQDYAANLRK